MTTANDFFENLVRWRGWCAEMIPSAEEWIKEGQARPGMKFDYNLFRHADGSVWGFGPNDSWIPDDPAGSRSLAEDRRSSE